MTRKEPKVGEVWSFNYERYLQLKDHKEYTYYKYKGYRVLDIKITYLTTNIIEAHDIYGKLFYLTENELLYFFDYDLNRNEEWEALMNIKTIIE